MEKSREEEERKLSPSDYSIIGEYHDSYKDRD